MGQMSHSLVVIRNQSPVNPFSKMTGGEIDLDCKYYKCIGAGLGPQHTTLQLLFDLFGGKTLSFDLQLSPLFCGVDRMV